MNLLDLLLILPVTYGAWVGFKKGFVIEIATLLALILGVWGAITFSDYVGRSLSENTSIDGRYVSMTAFTITFLGIAIGVYFLGKLIEKSINLVAMKPINKIAGLSFGAVKWLFAISVLLVIVEAFDSNSSFVSADSKGNSMLYEPVKTVSLTSIPALEDSQLILKEFNDKVEFLSTQKDSLQAFN
jgi:membrane protein required for colicin V production